MNKALVTGEKIAECFGIRDARFMSSRPLRRAELSITLLWREYDDGDNVVDLPANDGYLVVLYLIDVEHRDLWLDRPPEPIKTYPQGSICLISLRQGATIAIRGNFEALVFHVPRSMLAELADDAGEPRVDDLTSCRGLEDSTVRSIGAALLPLFDVADDVRDQLLPHVALAFNAHIAHRYGRRESRH